MDNLHDKYDLEIEYAERLLKFDTRDNDESGREMFWDLAGKIADELKYYKQEEQQEIIYNVLHKVRDEATKKNTIEDSHS